jgi:ligand-binding sensor domain-containing protein
MIRFLSILLFLPLFLAGRGRMGEWKAHLSFTQVLYVAETPDYMVGATSAGLLFVNKKTDQITTFTKAEGLSGVGISAIAYSSDADLLLIGYETGDLDLWRNGQITNFPDLTRKSELPNKKINRIVCEGIYAFLCCDFGVVKIDLKRREVSETWYPGAVDEFKRAFDLTSFGNSWWVATNHGLYKGEKTGVNLQDYRNWKLQTLLPEPNGSYSSLALANGQLFAHDQENDNILAYNGSSWSPYNTVNKGIRRIKSSAEGMIVVTQHQIWLTGKSGNTLIDAYPPETKGIAPMDACVDTRGEVWIGDALSGLTRRKSASTCTSYVPNSPESDQITALKSGTDAVFAATVTSNPDRGVMTSISIWQNEIWQNFSAASDAGLQSVSPITSFEFNRDHPGEFWAATTGTGLLYFQKNRVAANFNEMNSVLGATGGTCVITGLAMDSQNNLCFSNPTGKVRLGIRQANGTFVPLAYSFPGSSDSRMGQLLVTGTSIYWLVLPDEGLLAFRPKGNLENISDDQVKKITVKSRFSNGTTTIFSQFGNISALAEDHNHQLWVGTGSGVVVYLNPEKVFDPAEFYGIQPSSDDGEGLFKPILAKEKITAIAVDGGNRKWIGTAHSGLFLFSDQGEHLLKHFDSSNSPLFSDQILSIAIEPGSGELFIATSRGLISYKGEATAGESSLDKAYVWPNPLRENFEGVVTIDGLTEGTEIRITDISGNLVYRSSSIGGRALWNAKNGRGERVSTGIYLIFCNSIGKKESKIIKLLVIH